MPEKADPKLAAALQEGLRQDSADPDAADARFAEKAAAVEPADALIPPDESSEEEEDEDED